MTNKLGHVIRARLFPIFLDSFLLQLHLIKTILKQVAVVRELIKHSDVSRGSQFSPSGTERSLFCRTQKKTLRIQSRSLVSLSLLLQDKYFCSRRCLRAATTHSFQQWNQEWSTSARKPMHYWGCAIKALKNRHAYCTTTILLYASAQNERRLWESENERGRRQKTPACFFHVTPISARQRLFAIRKTPHSLLRKLLVAHGKK